MAKPHNKLVVKRDLKLCIGHVRICISLFLLEDPWIQIKSCMLLPMYDEYFFCIN